MIQLTEVPSEYLLHLEQVVDVNAPLATVFAALLEQMGAGNEMPDGTPMPMTLEAWPGGRWLRDLGHNSGHLWGHVQVIKPPKLLEITGPLFMSYPAISHLQYRLAEQAGKTQLTLVHRALGQIDPNHREGVGTGWAHLLKCTQKRAER